MEKYILLNSNNNNDNNYTYYDDLGNVIVSFGPIRRLNFLVGTNNSGKSRFMRGLINRTSKSIMYYPNLNVDTKNLHSQVRRIITNNDLQSYFNGDSRIAKILDNKNSLEKIMLLIQLISEKNTPFRDNLNNQCNILLNNNFSKTELKSTKYYYIPILRGIENFDKYFKDENISNVQMTKNDFDNLVKYKEQARKIYKLKIIKEYDIYDNRIFTAEDFYNDVVDILLGNEKGRKQFNEFEKFIDENFYDGKGFKINANKVEKCLVVKIHNDAEYEIYNLGDGIKQLIVILYQIFMHKDENYIFYIEEPEINLHPGFQRKLIELLMSETFKNHTYFVNTHSNHIIDIVNDYDDVSIFKFTKNDNITITPISNNNILLLNELGIRSSSVFLSNCTIWVEGISDRIYLKKYLELYFKKNNLENKYKENIHYSFVEYQGNNITHWSFGDGDDNKIDTSWLSHNIFLIVDNDNASSKPTSKKNIRHNELQNLLGNHFYKLNCREIENLISLNVLEKMLLKDNGISTLERKMYKLPRTKHFYNQGAISNCNCYLGGFIDSTYSNLKNKYTSTNSKTIKNKSEFAKKICEEINDWNDLTSEAQLLTTKIVDFINESNN